MKHLAPRALALLLAPCLSAQIAPGEALWSMNDFLIGPGGWQFVDLDAGTATTVSGLVGGDAGRLFALRIDPADGTVFASLTELSSPGEIRRVELAGGAVVAQTTVLSLGLNRYSGGCDLDRDGNLFATDNPFFGGTSFIQRVDGQTGATTVWATSPVVDLAYTALAIDDTTNTLWVLAKKIGAIFPTRLLRSPIEGGPVWTEVATINSNHGDGLDTDEAGNVWLTDELDAIHHYDDATGVLTSTPLVLEGSESPEWLTYDRRDGSLHVVMRGAGILGTYNNGGYYTFAQGSSVGSEVLDQCDIGDPTTVVLNDLIDETTVFPKTASVASPVTIRAAMHGEAGDLAALAIVAVGGAPIAPLVVGTPGVCDAGGFYKLQATFAPGSLPAGATLTIQGARLDLATGGIAFGSTVDFETVP